MAASLPFVIFHLWLSATNEKLQMSTIYAQASSKLVGTLLLVVLVLVSQHQHYSLFFNFHFIFKIVKIQQTLARVARTMSDGFSQF